MTQRPIKISLFSKPHCFTRSALEKNFTANASSINPNTTFTSVIHPPDLGNDCSQWGNMANNAKGKPNARPKPAAPAVKRPCSLDQQHLPTKVPRIGPVQEKETMANVPAIKNIPVIFPMPDFESALLANRPVIQFQINQKRTMQKRQKSQKTQNSAQHWSKYY